MFEKILLPLDGSELAEIALPYGEELARKLKSELILFHVCGSEHQQHHHMHQIYLDAMAEIVRHRIRRSRGGGKVKVKSDTLAGEPVETICDYVDKNNIGLMIMAASGASGLKLWRLGSVADKAFRTVCVPAMVIRAEGGKRAIKRILLPLDGSDVSEIALPFVEELAVKLKAGVTLFQMARRFLPYIEVEEGGGAGIDYARWAAAEERQVRAYLISVEKKLRQKGIAVTHNVVSGTDAASTIIEAGKKVDADLVVMSTHGRSPIRRWVFGSVAEKVLREGDIPLMLVRQAAG